MEVDFIPLDYEHFEHNGRSYAKIIGRNSAGKRICLIDKCDIYFWSILKKDVSDKKAEEIVEKIKNSSLIRKDLANLIKEKHDLLQKSKFFESEEKIEELAISAYDKKEFEEFKQKIQPILIEICKRFLTAKFSINGV